MKKLLSLAVALVMALSLAVPAAAAPAADTPAAGVPVMCNGEYLTFPDVQPVVKNGRTMVPFRTLAEALGGEVSYADGGSITCALPEASLSFTLGEDTVDVTDAAGTRTIQMDAPSYYLSGRTMVPVRFFAQALGYEVLWDSMEGAAVILDPAALAAEVDQHFTVVNRALQRLMAEEDKTYRTDLNYTFSMSVDYEGKAMPLEVSLQAQVIQSGSALELSGTVDLTKALTAQSLELLVGSGLSAADLLELQALFSKIEFQLRCGENADGSWSFYFFLPLLGTLSGGEMAEDAWYQMDLTAQEVQELRQVLGLDREYALTVGNLLYFLAYSNYSDWGGTNLWADVAEAGEMLAALLGDQALTKTAGGWRCDLDAAALEQLLGEPAGSAAEVFERFTCTLDLPDAGPVTLHLDIATVPDEWDDQVKLTGSVSLSAAKATWDVTLTVESLGFFRLQGSAATAPYAGTPAAAPPQGATIVNTSEL